MKNNNKSESSLRSFTTLAIVIASSLLLASCGGGDSTGSTTAESLSADSPNARAMAVTGVTTVPVGWTGRMPLPTVVKPNPDQIVNIKGTKVFKDVIFLSIKAGNESAATDFFIKNNWTPISRNGTFYQINISDKTHLTIDEKILKLQATGLFSIVDYDGIFSGNETFKNPDPSLKDSRYYNYNSIKISQAWDLVYKEYQNNSLNKAKIGVADIDFFDDRKDLEFDLIFNKTTGCNVKPITDNSNQNYCEDHSYHVAGIFGAKGDNGLQHVGIGSGATNSQVIYAASVFNKSSFKSVYAMSAMGAKIINLSIRSNSISDGGMPLNKDEFESMLNGANKSSDIIKELIDEEIKKQKALDVLYVQASGNFGDRLSYGIPEVTNYYSGFFNSFIENNGSNQIYKDVIDATLIVGAFDESRKMAEFTQKPHSGISKERFILAPGVNIYSNTLSWPKFLNDSTGAKSGTSMAAPHVTGVASLMLQVNKNLTAKEIATIILGTADSSLGTPYKSRVVGDGSNEYRYLNAEAAVKEAIAHKKCGAVSSPNIVGQLGPNYTATAGQKIQFTTTQAPKTGYPFGSYNWTTSDNSATLVNNGGTLADFVLNTAGTTKVTVTPVLADGTVCTSSAATAQVNVQATSVPAPSVSIEMSQTGLGFAGATGIGSYDYLSSLTSGIGKPAVKFNGGKFIVPNNQNMQFTDGATFDVWLRLDSMTGMDGWGNTGTNGNYAGAIIAKSHDRTGGALMVNGFGDTWVATYDPTWDRENCTRFFSASVPNGVWFRSTITLSPTTGMKGYTNKTLSWVCQPSNMSFDTMNSQDLYIGRFSDYWYPIPGAIADIKIYKSALTAAQISQLN